MRSIIQLKLTMESKQGFFLRRKTVDLVVSSHFFVHFLLDYTSLEVETAIPELYHEGSE